MLVVAAVVLTSRSVVPAVGRAVAVPPAVLKVVPAVGAVLVR